MNNISTKHAAISRPEIWDLKMLHYTIWVKNLRMTNFKSLDWNVVLVLSLQSGWLSYFRLYVRQQFVRYELQLWR